jgi:hypothetical protein
MSAQLHQICSSPFIENDWISNILGDGNWSNLAANQFRSRGVAYFLVLRSLCDVARSTTATITRDFGVSDIYGTVAN